MKIHSPIVSCQGTDVAAAYENVYYLSQSKPQMVRIRLLEIDSDIYDHCRVSYSADNGENWSDDQPYQVSWPMPVGVIRKDFGHPVVDPQSDRLVVLSTTSLLPSDQMLEALNYTFPTYRVSDDGGITWLFEDRILQRGDSETFTPKHPMESLWVGKNALHFANAPFFDSRGRLIAPAQITRLNPDGTLFCPPGALSFHEMMVLIGSWNEEGRLIWEIGEKVVMEPEISTRGAIEGSVAEMPDGRYLMVMRGSNAGNPSLPGHKWYCTSEDGCRTWSEVRPWGYTDGSLFHSPSSYSSIIKHSNGRYFWVGNICEENPDGNGPDFPIVIGEIDPESLFLRKETVHEIDTYRQDDPAHMHLRNFSLYEDRYTGDLVMRMTRLWRDSQGKYRGNACLYRMEP